MICSSVNRFFIGVLLWNGLYTFTVLNAGSGSKKLATRRDFLIEFRKQFEAERQIMSSQCLFHRETGLGDETPSALDRNGKFGDLRDRVEMFPHVTSSAWLSMRTRCTIAPVASMSDMPRNVPYAPV
ncbi:hypothetical protein [Burkholderia ubonensis]|uniref:hypothetical protein n=1 Tax=Burkholderia ubonensis TaxID=101571 RepID=UPI0012FBB28B|nr:hypothetical protein [Burkholderia ubonensis]